MAADRGIVLSVDTLELVERIRATRLYALKHTVSPAPVGLLQIAIAVALCLKDGNVHREAKAISNLADFSRSHCPFG